MRIKYKFAKYYGKAHIVTIIEIVTIVTIIEIERNAGYSCDNIYCTVCLLS